MRSRLAKSLFLFIAAFLDVGYIHGDEEEAEEELESSLPDCQNAQDDTSSSSSLESSSDAECAANLEYTDTDDESSFSSAEAWQPGDLNRMFERLTSEPYKSKYEVEILASPATDAPWVISMENVVSAEEAGRLIQLGHDLGYKRSKAVKKNDDDTYTKEKTDDRTSSTAWCKKQCLEDEHAMAVMDRIEELTGIPKVNSERLQLLRYDEGQFYKSHHDFIKYHEDKHGGPRILTVFLYLNDVAEGGGTKFDKVNITVTPKRGRAVVWPSVQDEFPTKRDKRTKHQALPVVEGVKYGANAWLHLRQWRGEKAGESTSTS